ncbi:MAG: DUF342 domain-containing protein [Lachnospiraceae bacterium]|nr:DUF342 domain-containing protein [Lachnospiraceae bacterium]
MPLTEETTYQETNQALNEKLYERELELCAQAGANSVALREAGYNVFQLEQIRQGLNEGLDVSVYEHPQYSWIDMEEIRKGLKQGIDMSRYREAGFSTEQKREIRKGIARGVDVSQYDRIEYLGEQMRQIRFGLMSKLPVVFYNNPAYNAAQMEEIRLGLEKNLDISLYAKPEMHYLKMRAIRRSMEDGLAFTGEEIEKYEEGILEQLHKAHLSHVDIRPYVEEGYNALQLEQIRISLEEKLHFNRYIRKDMRGENLKEIRLGLEANLEVALYARPEYRWRQMREIRLGLEKRLDVRKYISPYFEAAQMRQIRLGLEAGLDVTQYNSLVYTAHDMLQKRMKLQRGEKAGVALYFPDEIPVICEDPVLPYDRRPDPRLLREALQKEKHALEARKSGKIPVQTQEEAAKDPYEGLMMPSAGEVPLSSHARQVQQRKRQAEQEAQKIDMHGHNIVVSEDKMTCYLSLPAPKSGSVYTEELILAILARNHVTTGIDEAALKAIVRDGRYDEQIIIARGVLPENGKDGKYEYYFDRRNATNPEMTPDGSADWSRSHFYSEVQAGDVIATYIPAQEGTDGYTVTGEVLPARNGREKPVLKGSGFLLMEDGVSYAAAVSGVARTEGYELHINRLLVLTQDVIEPHKVIDFLGSVHVKCNLMPGTELRVQGDVIMETVAESLRITAGGDVVLKEGATGRTRGMIEAQGSVSGKYFANYEIIAQGGVFSNSFLHCNVDTEEKLVCFGDNGTIYGGVIQARLGLECAVIGTETGVPTLVVLGITTAMLQDYNKAEKKAERIASELQTLNAELEKVNAIPVQSRELMQLKIKLGAAHTIKLKELNAAEEEKAQVSAYINSVAGSESLISKTLYAGTTLNVDESEIRIVATKEATEEKPITIKGKAKQWKIIQKKS